MIKPLAKRVLIPLGLTAAASAADAGIHKKFLGSGNTTTLIISKFLSRILQLIGLRLSDTHRKKYVKPKASKVHEHVRLKRDEPNKAQLYLQHEAREAREQNFGS